MLTNAIVQKKVAEAFRAEKDNGVILPRSHEGDILAKHLRKLHEQRDDLVAQIATTEAAICKLIGTNSGVDTLEGSITWKKGSTGDVDWRGVAKALGSDARPSVIAAFRRPATRRFLVPRAWKVR
jgi:hypothetical protein